jgi:hypothetical protein
MDKYTFYYTVHERYEAVIEAESFEQASDQIYEQFGVGIGHELLDSLIEIDDYAVEAIDG